MTSTERSHANPEVKSDVGKSNKRKLALAQTNAAAAAVENTARIPSRFLCCSRLVGGYGWLNRVDVLPCSSVDCPKRDSAYAGS